MMTLNRLIVLLAGLAAWPGWNSAAAQERGFPYSEEILAPAPQEAITLDELAQVALANNPTIGQAAAGVAAARGRWVQAGLLPNPVLSYSGVCIGNMQSAGQHGVTVSQNLLTAQKASWGRAVASAEIDRAMQQLAAQRRRVLNDLFVQFFEALAAQQMTELSTALVRVADDGVKAAQARFDAEEVGRADLLQASAARRRAELDLASARLRLTAARRRLAAIAAVERLPDRPLAGDLGADLPMREWEPTLQRLLQESPQVAAAAFGVDRARMAIDQAVATGVPNVSLQGGVQYDFMSNDPFATVGVSVPVPIRNRNQGGVREAEAEFIQARRELDRVIFQLREQLAAAFQDYETARLRFDTLDRQIAPDLLESVRLIQIGYRAGEYDYTNLLTAQRNYFQAMMDRLDAWLAYRQADIRLEGLLLSGGLSPAEN